MARKRPTRLLLALFWGEWTLVFWLEMFRHLLPDGPIGVAITRHLNGLEFVFPNVLFYYVTYAIAVLSIDLPTTLKAAITYFSVLILLVPFVRLLAALYARFGILPTLLAYGVVAAVFYGGVWAYPRTLACYFHDIWCIGAPQTAP